MLTVLFADRTQNWPAYEGALTAEIGRAHV